VGTGGGRCILHLVFGRTVGWVHPASWRIGSVIYVSQRKIYVCHKFFVDIR